MIGKFFRISFMAMLHAVFSLSVAAAPGPVEPPIEHARLLGALQLQGEVFHVQGLALAPKRLWVTSVDHTAHKAWLHEFERASGKFVRRLELTDGARYHPGGLSVSGNSIWVPVSEMRANSSAVMVEIGTDTLQVRRRIAVADHIGCVAASGQTLIAGNWDSRLLYVFDLAREVPSRLVPVRAVPNPSATHYQDMKFADGKLVAGGNTGWISGTVDWIDWQSMKLTRSIKAGSVGTLRPFGRGGPYTGEGMAIEGRELYFVPEDGPSRVFHFRLDA